MVTIKKKHPEDPEDPFAMKLSASMTFLYFVLDWRSCSRDLSRLFMQIYGSAGSIKLLFVSYTKIKNTLFKWQVNAYSKPIDYSHLALFK